MNAARVVDEIPTIPLPQTTREKARKRLRALQIRLDRPLFGLHAGGFYGPAKHWGDDRYTELPKRLRAAEYDVVLLTSPGENAQAGTISSAYGGVPVIGQDGDLPQLAAAI